MEAGTYRTCFKTSNGRACERRPNGFPLGVRQHSVDEIIDKVGVKFPHISGNVTSPRYT